jgi:ankyrin repeat protein
MRVLLLHKEEEDIDELRLLFPTSNASNASNAEQSIDTEFDTLALSSGGEDDEIFPALLQRLRRQREPAAAFHLLVLSAFSPQIFAFLAGFACGSELPVAVYGAEALASVPAACASSFKALKDKKSLIRYLESEGEKAKNEEARSKAGTAREILLQAGIPVTGESLARCVSEGMVRELSFFLAAGFSPDTLDEAGVPLLNLAVRAGNADMLRALLEAGAGVDLPAGDRGSSALLDAVMIRRPDLVQILIEGGADVNLKKKDGQSALIVAAGAGDAVCAELLLKAGADPDDTDVLGASARKYALLFHNSALLALFDTYAPSKAG